jgi:excisionase family DNA binding protein
MEPERGGGARTSVLLSADEVAELLGVRRDWVYAQSRAGTIPTVTLGRYRRYRREAIEDWINALERASVGPLMRGGREAPPCYPPRDTG